MLPRTLRFAWLFYSAPDPHLAMARPTDRSHPTMKNFDRITVDPGQMSRVSCVRHLQIPAAAVTLGQSAGKRFAAHFAAASAMGREMPLLHSAWGTTHLLVVSYRTGN
jgi:hypothetical protein